ncbi:hypothetical protein KJ611_03295 [Patescibacteria group bacterium]|nr:hypothetical protein [Patescibacteria group bacterium]MBU1705485.1 hypothetical protein [Patescibacteria group bacterium]
MHLHKQFLSVSCLMIAWITVPPALAQESNEAYVRAAKAATANWQSSGQPQALLVAFSAWQDALDNDYYALQDGVSIEQSSPTEVKYRKFCQAAFQPLLEHWPDEGLKCAEFLGIRKQADTVLELKRENRAKARQKILDNREALGNTKLRYERIVAMGLWEDAGDLALKLDGLRQQCRALAEFSNSDKYGCEHDSQEESVFEKFCVQNMARISDEARGMQEKCLAALGAKNQAQQIAQIPNFKDQKFGVLVTRTIEETDTGVFPMNAAANAVRADLHSMIKAMGGQVVVAAANQEGITTVSVTVSGMQAEDPIEGKVISMTPCRVEMRIGSFVGTREKQTTPEVFTEDLREMTKSLFSQYLVDGTYPGAQLEGLTAASAKKKKKANKKMSAKK